MSQSAFHPGIPQPVLIAFYSPCWWGRNSLPYGYGGQTHNTQQRTDDIDSNLLVTFTHNLGEEGATYHSGFCGDFTQEQNEHAVTVQGRLIGSRGWAAPSFLWRMWLVWIIPQATRELKAPTRGIITNCAWCPLVRTVVLTRGADYLWEQSWEGNLQLGHTNFTNVEATYNMEL